MRSQTTKDVATIGKWLVAVAVLLALTSLFGCGGLPTIDVGSEIAQRAALQYDRIELDVDRGLAEMLAAGEISPEDADVVGAISDGLSAALNDGISPGPEAFPTVRPYAERGIGAREAAGEIGPGVAASLIERLDRFEELLEQLSK